jgi:hypothetical protein
MRLRLIAVALLAGASSGCILPGLAWFPDSSGFVYTGGKTLLNQPLSSLR